MKRFFVFLLLAVSFFECKSEKNIQFCEGVSTEGAGVNCWDRFSTGELTAIVKSKGPFGLEVLKIKIIKLKEIRPAVVDEIEVKVKPDDEILKTNIYFYEEGSYNVEVIGKDGKKIAQGNIQIIDVY